jgi:inorganic pyrophosphatase
LLKGYTTSSSGELATTNHRIHFQDSKGMTISPWHDIPLMNRESGFYHFISEIPKNTRKKFEISTKEKLNPIAQDIKNGKLRDYHGPIFWNYGCIPQTWENPYILHPTLNWKGDNDPLDVVEIGSQSLECGSVVPVS